MTAQLLAAADTQTTIVVAVTLAAEAISVVATTTEVVTDKMLVVLPWDTLQQLQWVVMDLKVVQLVDTDLKALLTTADRTMVGRPNLVPERTMEIGEENFQVIKIYVRFFFLLYFLLI